MALDKTFRQKFQGRRPDPRETLLSPPKEILELNPILGVYFPLKTFKLILL